MGMRGSRAGSAGTPAACSTPFATVSCQSAQSLWLSPADAHVDDALTLGLPLETYYGATRIPTSSRSPTGSITVPRCIWTVTSAPFASRTAIPYFPLKFVICATR